VTQAAEVAVNNASRKLTVLPSGDAIGSTKSMLPSRMINAKPAAIILGGLNLRKLDKAFIFFHLVCMQ
jgi:hypothetical protein